MFPLDVYVCHSCSWYIHLHLVASNLGALTNQNTEYITDALKQAIYVQRHKVLPNS